MRRKLSAAIAAEELASSAAQASASPISAIAAASDIETSARAAMIFWIAGRPDATRSIRSASENSGERDSTIAATSGWSEASAATICAGA